MNDELRPLRPDEGDDAPGVPAVDDRVAALHAVFDDVADDRERAVVADDPAARAELDGLARLRATMGAVEPPPGAREAAIVAALAAFDAAAAPAGAPRAPVVSLDERRRRRQRWAMSAAAAVAAGFVGVAVIGGGGTSNVADPAEQAAKVTVVEEAPAEAGRESDTASEEDVTMALPMTDDAGAATEMAPSATAEAGDVLAAETADTAGDVAAGGAGEAAEAEATTAASGSDGMVGVPPPTIGSLDGPATATPSIDDPLALSSYAATAAPGADAGRCAVPGWTYLGPVVFQGVDAVVGLDPATDEVVAISIDDCGELARTPGA